MVQYIITPWRDRRELLSIRQAFYPSPDLNKAIRDRERLEAVALVSVWVQRGNCPHSVESTAILVSAMLNEAVGNSAYAMRAAYSAAFSRFVTGLLDGYQDKNHKISMHSIAKNIGLPASFVELRHQCTHEELPSLPKLRAAAERSLTWIWDHYWKNLEVSSKPANIDEYRTILRKYLQWPATGPSQDEEQRQDFAKRLRKWDSATILDVLMESADTRTMDTGVLLQLLRLSRAMLSGRQDHLAFESFADEPVMERKVRSLDDIRAEIAGAHKALQEEEENRVSLSQPKLHSQDVEMEVDDEDEAEGKDDDGNGWQMWNGPWVPKPIGIV